MRPKCYSDVRLTLEELEALFTPDPMDPVDQGPAPETGRGARQSNSPRPWSSSKRPGICGRVARSLGAGWACPPSSEDLLYATFHCIPLALPKVFGAKNKRRALRVWANDLRIHALILRSKFRVRLWSLRNGNEQRLRRGPSWDFPAPSANASAELTCKPAKATDGTKGFHQQDARAINTHEAMRTDNTH